MANDEIVAIVDEHNNVVGSSTRLEMRSQALPHRATYILVFNSAGELYVQKRTLIKDMYPGYYDLAAGGVVLADESYELSAEREVAEELGITDTPLESCFDFYYQDPRNRVWGRAFKCCYDGQLTLQPEEVQSGEFMTLEAAASDDLTPVTPDTRYALDLYLETIRR